MAAVPEVFQSSGIANTTPVGVITEVNLATITLPSNKIGANGLLVVNCLWSKTVNAGTVRVLFGNSEVHSWTLTGTGPMPTRVELVARSSLTSQTSVNYSPANRGSIAGNSSYNTLINTAQPVVILITCTPADAGSTVTLEAYSVIVTHLD